MPTVEANGLTVEYHTEGAGPPLILLHGATSSGREDFLAQLPAFRRAFHLYVPDARGHAGTIWDTRRGFSTEMLVADLLAFADALGLQTFHVLGFSMGSMTALQFAVAYPDRLRTLVLVGCDTQREPRTAVSRRLMDPQRVDRDDPAWAAELERRHGPQGAGAWRDLLPAIAADVATQPLLEPKDLRRVTCPAMVVVGDRDPFVPVFHAEQLHRQLSHAQLFVVPGCDHNVPALRPGLFSEACRLFYQKTAPVARERAEALAGSSAVHSSSPLSVDQRTMIEPEPAQATPAEATPAEATPSEARQGARGG
jgi:pimeloyl-ACP methyl ester carboxylesterase